MHTMLAPGGAYAEFAVARAGTTLRIPEGMNFEGISFLLSIRRALNDADDVGLKRRRRYRLWF